MVYTNKIEAIKAVRAIGANVTLTKAEDGRVYLNPNNLGLKDAKDLVEAIMELGVAQALSEGATRLRQLEAAEAPQNEHERRLYDLEQGRRKQMENIRF